MKRLALVLVIAVAAAQQRQPKRVFGSVQLKQQPFNQRISSAVVLAEPRYQGRPRSNTFFRSNFQNQDRYNNRNVQPRFRSTLFNGISSFVGSY
ncbi:unnamed protein product, partial [Meganyctiphanes norvegica]